LSLQFVQANVSNKNYSTNNNHFAPGENPATKKKIKNTDSSVSSFTTNNNNNLNSNPSNSNKNNMKIKQASRREELTAENEAVISGLLLSILSQTQADDGITLEHLKKLFARSKEYHSLPKFSFQRFLEKHSLLFCLKLQANPKDRNKSMVKLTDAGLQKCLNINSVNYNYISSSNNSNSAQNNQMKHQEDIPQIFESENDFVVDKEKEYLKRENEKLKNVLREKENVIQQLSNDHFSNSQDQKLDEIYKKVANSTQQLLADLKTLSDILKSQSHQYKSKP